MKARSSLLILMVQLSSLAWAALPGNKRTVFTSGEKVFPIHYQLGQSTVIDLKTKPEVVICGNKNYFNIEKLKSGITIQPLGQISTNLTILSGQKRFLFYITPAGAMTPDGFVDVKWVSPDQQKTLRNLDRKADTIIQLNESVKIDSDLELTVIRLKVASDKSRRIFDLKLKNSSKKTIGLDRIEVILVNGKTPIKNQALVWEKNQLEGKSEITGRIILMKEKSANSVLLIRYNGQTLKVKLKGVI